MSKKKSLLNEQTIRRFGGLAGIKAGTTNNFLTEMEVGEDELADALAAGAEAMADTLGLDVSVEVEAGEDAGEEIDDLEDDFGDLEGEEDDIEGEIDDLEGEEDAIDDEEGFIDDEEDDIEDETLDELINRILDEDSGGEEAEHYFHNRDADRDEADELEARGDKRGARKLRHDADYDDEHIKLEGEGSKKGEYKRRGKSKDHPVGRRAGDVDGHYKAYEMDEDKDYTAKKEKRGADTRKGAEIDGAEGTLAKTKGHGRVDYANEGHIRVVDDEFLMKEVAKRVKQRLARMVKENRNRNRTKRRK